MEIRVIHATARTGTGKGAARKMRAAGKMPAVAYGEGGGSVSLCLDPNDLRELKAKSPLGWNQPVKIEVEGGDDIDLALLKDVQRHPVSGNLLHADFQTLRADLPVQVSIPVRTTGKAVGEALGGNMRVVLRSVLVSCLAKDIPEAITVDVTPLGINDQILLSELPVPPGVEVVKRLKTPVLACFGKRGAALADEEEEAEEAAEESAG